MGLKRRGHDRFAKAAWVGGTERILQLARAMEDLSEPFRERAKKRAAQIDTDDQDSEARRKNLQERYTVTITTREKDLSLVQEGTPEEVIGEADPLVVRSLTLTTGYTAAFGPRFFGGGYMLDEPPMFFRMPPSEQEAVGAGVYLSRADGVSLEVTGTDPDWIRSAFAALREEISRGVPKWGWLRRAWLWPAWAVLGGVLTALALAPTLADSASLLATLSVAGGIAFGTALTLLARFLLPGFQLLAPGQVPRAARVLGLVGTIVLQVLIAISVNLATR